LLKRREKVAVENVEAGALLGVGGRRFVACDDC
jgi:hypothetical protein